MVQNRAFQLYSLLETLTPVAAATPPLPIWERGLGGEGHPSRRECQPGWWDRRFVVRRSSFVVRRPSSVVRRSSSFVLRRSSFVVRRPSASYGILYLRTCVPTQECM